MVLGEQFLTRAHLFQLLNSDYFGFALQRRVQDKRRFWNRVHYKTMAEISTVSSCEKTVSM